VAEVRCGEGRDHGLRLEREGDTREGPVGA
jgi:hypothetical protein